MAQPGLALEHGIKVSTFEPPPHGFDPLTAKAADLERFGFPPRLDTPHHLARYKRVMNHLKPKFQYIPPTFRVNNERSHGPRKRQPTDATETSGN